MLEWVHMEPLDVKHELPLTPEPPELPPPHHAQGKSWIFSVAVGSFAMFVVTLVLVAFTKNLLLALAAAPVTLVFATFIAHAVTDRAK